MSIPPSGWGAVEILIWDYYQTVSIQSVVISAIILITASIVSIGYKLYKTTRLNPSNVLRDE